MKTITKLLLAFFVLAVSLPSLSAQSYSEYLKHRTYWSDHKLTLADFRMDPPALAPDSIKSFISLTSEPYKATIKKGCTTYEYYWTKTYMHPMESWYRPDAVDENGLKLMQIKFDLWELFARKSVADFGSSTEFVDWNEMWSYYRSLYDRRVDELNHVSENGKIRENIDRYADIVAKELEEVTYDPIAVADTVKYKIGGLFSAGFLFDLPRTDYVSPAYGVDLMVGVYARSFLYGMTLDFAGARCRKYIETHKGEINKGDALLAGGLGLIVGKTARQKQGYSLTPYLGIGAKFYDGGTNFEPKNDNDDTTEKAGLSLGMGALIEIPLKHTVYIKTNSPYGVNSNTHSLLIKPYLNCTKFHGDMGWVPSVNIAVSYCFESHSSFHVW